MSDVEDLAKHVSSETPWWATAPVWLAAGIVGVPALMAIASGYYIAQNVTASLKQLTTYNLSELHMFNEHLTVSQHNFEVVLKFMDDDLRAQYQACLNSAEREREYGISPAPVRRQNKSSSAPANP